MKIKQALLAITLLISSFATYAANTEIQYVQTVAETVSGLAKNQQAIWPDFNVSATPIVLYFTQSKHLYAVNGFKPKQLPWQAFPMAGGATGYYLPQEQLGMAKYKFSNGLASLDGQNVFVFPVKSFEFDNIGGNINFSFVSARFFAYLLLEVPSFKPLIQQAMFDPAASNYEACHDKNSIKLLYLELAILKKYTENYLDKASSDEYLKDYVAIEKFRTRTLTKNALSYEKYGKLSFISAYAVWRAVHLNDADFMAGITSSADRLPKLEEGQTEFKSSDFYEITSSLFDSASQEFLTPVVGFALDKLEPGWKHAVEVSQQSPDAILAQHYSAMTDTDINQRADKAMKTDVYGFSVINQTVDTFLDLYLKELGVVQKKYEDQPGVEVTFEIETPRYNLVTEYKMDSEHGLVDAEYGAAHTYAIASNDSLIAVKPEITTLIKARNLSVRLANVNYYFESENSLGRESEVYRFKLPADATVSMDGNDSNLSLEQYAKLYPGQKILFGNLELKGSASFKIYYHPFSASIEFADNKVKITVIKPTVELPTTALALNQLVSKFQPMKLKSV